VKSCIGKISLQKEGKDKIVKRRGKERGDQNEKGSVTPSWEGLTCPSIRTLSPCVKIGGGATSQGIQIWKKGGWKESTRITKRGERD